MKLKTGTIIQSPLFPEPVKVETVEEIGDYIRIVGVQINSNQHVDDVIPKEEFYKLTESSHETDFTANAEEVFLGLEAYRFRLASLFDPILAMNVSRVDPLPHQIEAVYGYVLKLPKIRFLIADDPGAGKTIMAGLVIKEQKLRGLVKRILIVVPGYLKDQWRRELKEKFSETFVIVDRHTMRAHFGENVWKRNNQVITSMDFAKREAVLQSLSSVDWNLVIVDEAHKMAAHRYREHEIDKSARYKLGEVLSKRTDHLLFLTATPHKGDPENFRLFLDLLEPGFFHSEDMLKESLKNRDNPLFIRRLKEDMRDFDGNPLFLPRHVTTVTFSLTEEEAILYNDLTDYVSTQYDKASKHSKKRNVAFALTILQRRMASSVHALKCSLMRRKKRLKRYLKEGIAAVPPTLKELEGGDEYEDYEEKERWRIEQEWETVSVAETREELEKEIKILKRLIIMAEDIIAKEKEVKLQKLKELMESIDLKEQKILIFTESRDTLEYLQEKLISWGYHVTSIHGGKDLEERIKAEKEFKHEAQVMVATEAAGEGINLQFCNIMINYDIPWNPNRLEQRMGRIHRYGQKKEVFIYNLVNRETREGRVLSRLLEKIEEIRGVLGDKVFDVIGEILPGKDFSQLVTEAAANARDVNEILSTIEAKLDEEYINKVKAALGESLATRFIDYTRIKEMTENVKESRLMPEYTEHFFVKAFKKAGGGIKRKGVFYHIDAIPYQLRKLAEEDTFKNTWGVLARKYKNVTFDKDVAQRHADAEFVSFGHPLFEVVIEWVLNHHGSSLLKGATFKDPSGVYNGVIFFFEGEVKDGNGIIAGKKLFAIYKNERTGELRAINPSLLWDLSPSTGAYTFNEEWKKEAERHVIEELMTFKEELYTQRLKQAQIKEKYGIKSLEKTIRDLDMKLIDYEQRKKQGENMDLAISNAKKRKNEREEDLKNLKSEIEREKNLTVKMPTLVGVVRVIPSDEMVNDVEIERIGMEIAMAHERKHGRIPEDVSTKHLGYDIRSKSTDGEVLRYIEVKARATTGDVALTPNEWFKAQRFREQYWLYIVENAATNNPTLYTIKNPAEQLEVIEKVETVRFIVPPTEWKKKVTPNPA